MIDLLDDALREYLLRELPVRDNEIDISFDQPRREWSARLSRPTLNIYLRDIRENIKLRAPSPGGTFTRAEAATRFEREAVRVELAYMMTAWAKDPLDEHRMLSRLLAALFRFRGLPKDIAAEFLPEQPADVYFRIAQPETTISANDLWSVLDNEMRPFVDVIAQISIMPYAVTEVPLVRSLEISLVQRYARGGSPSEDEGSAAGGAGDGGGGPGAPGAGDAPGRTRLPVRITQSPNGKTPDAKRSTPPWPANESEAKPAPPSAKAATPSAKPKGGKNK